MQRAFVNIFRIANQESRPDELAISCNATYINFESLDFSIDKGIGAFAPWDSSPREILNAVASEVVLQQPLGFNLTERDVILTNLDRG